MFESNINIDEELKKCRTMDDLMGKNGLLQRLVGPMVERLLEAELEDKLGYPKFSDFPGKGCRFATTT